MPASGTHDGVATVDEVVALRTVIGRLWRQIRLSAGGELTSSQSSALSRLDVDGPMRLTALAAAEGLAASTASRIVASLEALGYVERLADATDRRASVLTVTTSGSGVLDERRSRAADALAEALSELDTEDRRALRDATPALEHIVQLLVERASSARA